jgi:hypothetical protein
MQVFADLRRALVLVVQSRDVIKVRADFRSSVPAFAGDSVRLTPPAARVGKEAV